MSGAEWYLALYSVGVGGTLIAFWSWVGVTGRLASLGAGRDDFGFHAAAEVVTGSILLAAGLGLLLADDAAWPPILAAVGVGALVYALVESPGHYLARGHRMMVAAVGLGWLFTVPALIVLFT